MKKTLATLTILSLSALPSFATTSSNMNSRPKTVTSDRPQTTNMNRDTDRNMDRNMDRSANTNMNRDMESTNNLNKRTITDAQEALKTRGFNIKNSNGEMDSDTTSAIRSFQKKNSLKQTGTLNAETMRKLNINSSKYSE